LLESTGNLNKIANISWQLGNENGFTYNTASLSIQPEGIQKAAPFWVFLPEAKTVGKPEFISWSEKESHRDLIFQDSENNLTVVDKDGLERWRVRLEGPVMGNIKTIDFYRNGDFQVLFNTAKALHMLNRNGREMKNFPVKLKSPATNEVSVCDYSDTKEYRFLLACKDRKVYNFDKTGKTISGWQVPTTSQVVTMPVQHYLSGKKDYIIIREEDNIL
jgi:hypothetical protein